MSNLFGLFWEFMIILSAQSCLGLPNIDTMIHLNVENVAHLRLQVSIATFTQSTLLWMAEKIFEHLYAFEGFCFEFYKHALSSFCVKLEASFFQTRKSQNGSEQYQVANHAKEIRKEFENTRF